MLAILIQKKIPAKCSFILGYTPDNLASVPNLPEDGVV